MSTLVTIARCQKCPSLASVDADVLTPMIAAASAAIEKYCRRDFVLQAHIDIYDGDGTNEMALDHFPIGALTSVVLIDTTGVETDVPVANFRLNTKVGVVRCLPTDFGYFPSGFQNIRVNYTAGFDPVPEDVQEAAVQLVAYIHAAGEADPTKQSEQLGDYSYSAGQQTMATGEITLPMTTRMLVSQYRNLRG